MKKTHLDEMQERKLLQIEHNGCWLSFWGLLILILGQMVLWPERFFQRVMGEWMIFMVLALYLVIACARQGIWDRKWQASHRTNLLRSLTAALVTGGVMGVMMWKAAGNWQTVTVVGVSTFLVTVLLCMIGSESAMAAYKRRREQLDQEE